MNEHEDFLAGYPRIINAAGTFTRLGGTLMRPETVQAMANASGHFFEMAELQAWASEVIARVTGAEGGYVTSGAAAALTLAAAACIAGLDPRIMLNEAKAHEGILQIDPFNLDVEGAEAIASRLLDLCAR